MLQSRYTSAPCFKAITRAEVAQRVLSSLSRGRKNDSLEQRDIGPKMRILTFLEATLAAGTFEFQMN